MTGLLALASMLGVAWLSKKKGKSISGISGLKHYYIQYGVGKSKYIVNFHDGVRKHSDGSPMFLIAIFNNKKELNKFIRDLEGDGYVKANTTLTSTTALEKWYLNNLDYIELEAIDGNFVYAHIYEKDGTGGTTTIDYETANHLIKVYNAQWI